jgi:hypothetical protein
MIFFSQEHVANLQTMEGPFVITSEKENLNGILWKQKQANKFVEAIQQKEKSSRQVFFNDTI